MRRMVCLLCLALIAAACLPGQEPGEPFPRTVIDMAGQAVSLDAPPQRVLVFGDSWLVDRVLPPGLRVPLDPATPEAVAWETADLLVMPTWAAAAYPALLARAQAAGVPLFQLGAVPSLTAWRSAVEALGTLTGQDVRSERTAAWLDTQLDVVARRVRGVPPERALVLTPEGYTFGRGTLIDDLIAAAGGANAASAYDDYRQIDDHAIRSLAPDVILLTESWEPSQIAALRTNPAFADLLGLRILTLPFSPTQPPDPGAAALWLAAHLHPAQFPLWERLADVLA